MFANRNPGLITSLSNLIYPRTFEKTTKKAPMFDNFSQYVIEVTFLLNTGARMCIVDHGPYRTHTVALNV